MSYKWNDILFPNKEHGKTKKREKQRKEKKNQRKEKKGKWKEKKNRNEDGSQKGQEKNGWREGERCKQKMEDNPYQLG